MGETRYIYAPPLSLDDVDDTHIMKAYEAQQSLHHFFLRKMRIIPDNSFLNAVTSSKFISTSKRRPVESL